MTNDDHIKTKVLIAGRTYPLKIKPSEEQEINEIVQRIEDCVGDLKSKFPQKDAQDYLAMTLLTLGAELTSTENPTLSTEIENKLQSINGWLDKISE